MGKAAKENPSNPWACGMLSKDLQEKLEFYPLVASIKY